MASRRTKRFRRLRAALLDAGLSEPVAEEIAGALHRRHSHPLATGLLATITVLGFTIVTAFVGMLLLEVHGNRDLIEANRDRIEIVNLRLTWLAQRIARIETILDERLAGPPLPPVVGEDPALVPDAIDPTVLPNERDRDEIVPSAPVP